MAEEHGPFGPFRRSFFAAKATWRCYYFSNSTVLCPWARQEKILDPKVNVMAWTTPVFEEVVLCCEINSYVSAKL